MKKNKFRVQGIPSADGDMNAFAQRLEGIMNLMHDEGYEVQVLDQTHGVLVLGALPSTDIFQVNAHAEETEDELEAANLGVRSRELLVRFLSITNAQDPKVFREVAKKQVSTLIKGFSTRELTTAAKELAAEADHHESAHDDPNCTLAHLLRVISALLTDAAKTQLQ